MSASSSHMGCALSSSERFFFNNMALLLIILCLRKLKVGLINPFIQRYKISG